MSDPNAPDVVDMAEGLQINKRSGIKKPTVRDIKKSRRDDDDFMSLVRELGLVARAMTYDNGDEIDLYNALTRVAAVAVSITRSLKVKKVYRAIHTEMNQAVVKHTWAMTPLNPQMPGGQKLVVLVEEFGEAAEDPGDAAEYIQIATMAGAWAASLRAQKPQDWVTT